jgi:hypothetical protein
MSCPRWMALAVLVIVGGLVAGCGGQAAGAKGETTVTPTQIATPVPTSVPTAVATPVPVSVTRTGGIAGVNQTIDIAPDGNWVYTDKRSNRTETGTLATAQRLLVLRFVTDPAFVDELTNGATPDPRCADGFRYTINTGGESGSFDDCGPDGPPVVKAAIAAITEATPF